MKLHIKRWGINGEGIGYTRKTPVFVEGAIPGELVDAEITEKNPRYQTAVTQKVLQPSARRRYPICDKWQECGGCSLMHVDYKGQVRMKEQVLKEALKKYAGYTGPIAPLVKNPSVLAYRNAIKMPFGKKDGQIITGMYRRNSNSFVPVERCIVHSKTLEKVRQTLHDVLNRHHMPVWDSDSRDELISLVMKEFDGKVHVVLITSPGMKLPPALVEDIMSIENVASLWQSEKSKMQENEIDIFGRDIVHIAGDQKMELHLKNLDLELLPRSFFQLNTAQAENLYDRVLELIPEKNGLVVEAYSGIGVMSLLASQKAEHVIGIEYVEDAIRNATENAQRNNIENVEFICGDAAKKTEEVARTRRIDTLIVDPPRSGLSTEMIDAICAAQPESMIYVSCNPSTLAKDLHRLQKIYDIQLVQPIDMFSQTPHVESIVLLKKKN